MPERRTRIFARRAALAGSPAAPARRWPTHLVTAPHRAVQEVGSEHPRVPYGEWHARRAGSLETACGRSAVTWQFFWTLDFRQAGGRACPECARVVSRLEPGTARDPR